MQNGQQDTIQENAVPVTQIRTVKVAVPVAEVQPGFAAEIQQEMQERVRVYVKKQGVLEYLEEIRKRAKDHVLRPEDVVEAASDPNSILHDYFEWDNERAGHRYRLMQARALIRGVRVVREYRTLGYDAPVYVRSPIARANEQGYMKLEEVQKRQRRWVIDIELRRVYGDLERLKSIAAELELEKEFEAADRAMRCFLAQGEDRVP